VDLGNAISIRNFIPLGAHDIDTAGDDIYVRISRDNDKFIPFGETEAESLDEGEIVYSVGNKIKTRRWIWRQSEEGKVTEESSNIFFPLDGFKANKERLLKARDELAVELENKFGCKIKIGYLDKETKEFEIK
jgi:DNA/RNA-binding domain of Phe-tRNA-synthetase-like protein